MDLRGKASMKKFYKRAWAEIRLDNLKYNLDICRSFLKGNTEIVAVVKANAYGHGDTAIAPFLQSQGVNWFAVSNINEAINLREHGITKEILILGYVMPTEAQELCEYNIIQAVTGLAHAKELSQNAPQGKKVRVHIKIDTGMGRIGLRHHTAKGYADEIEEISKLKNIKVEGIFTHLSVADTDEKRDVAYTDKQINTMLEIKKELDSRHFVLKQFHFLNSAGATYHATAESTLARYGIMLYGLHPNVALDLPKPLKPVMELKTIVAHIKTIEEHEYVSYGRTYCSDRPTRVATLAIGYADGYSRLLSSKAEVLINGRRAKVIGRVCMDQTMVDVTDIDVKVGDTATLFGKDGDDEITADDLASLYGTIGYEIICGISKRVPRLIYENGSLKDILEW